MASTWPRFTARIMQKIKGAYFPTILGEGAPSFRNHFRQKKVYLSIVARVESPPHEGA